MYPAIMDIAGFGVDVLRDVDGHPQRAVVEHVVARLLEEPEHLIRDEYSSEHMVIWSEAYHDPAGGPVELLDGPHPQEPTDERCCEDRPCLLEEIDDCLRTEDMVAYGHGSDECRRRDDRPDDELPPLVPVILLEHLLLQLLLDDRVLGLILIHVGILLDFILRRHP